MKFATRILLIVLSLGFVFGYAGATGSSEPPAVETGDTIYAFVREGLDKDDQWIDYDTLWTIHGKLTQAPAPVPGIERLLEALIHQRSENPRVDQMVLICAANIIGKSRFPIPDAPRLFEEMLLQDDGRINDWVLVYVAEAIGDYRVDLPNGDRLVDTVEAHQARIKAEHGNGAEYFGTHFLPPPKSERIRSYIAGIQDQGLRESERRAYYMLIYNRISEASVVAALDHIETHGALDTKVPVEQPMRHLVVNWASIQDALALEAKE